MAREASKPRFVKCPRCLRLLMETADVPVYKCGVCGTILQAKVRHADLQGNPPCSTSENSSRGDEPNDLSEEGDPPPCGEHAEMDADTISVVPSPPSQHDGSGMHSKHGSVNSLDLPESVISEEEVFDEIPGSSQIRNPVPSIGSSSSRSYELGVSSGDDNSGKLERYRRLSRRTFSNRDPSESSGGGAVDRKDGDLAGIKNQTAPANEMRDASSVGISGSKQRSFSRNYARPSEPGDPSRSGGFFPLPNEMESDHLSSASRSPSRDSISAEDFPCDVVGDISSRRLGNLQRDREVEPLRRVDLLRDQPAKPCAGGRRGDQRLPVGGHDGHRLPTALYNGDMSEWQSAASRRKTTAQTHQSKGIPFSGEGSGSRLHHHPEGWRVPAHCRPCSPQTHFHPSTAASSGFSDLDRDVSLCHGGESSSDNHRVKLPGEEKPQHKKRRRQCRPVSGGAPFVVCNKCWELLQLPVDFLISRGRLHKLRCGACSEVLTFLYQGGHIVPHHAGIQELSADRPSQGTTLHEDPVSYSEENGPPPSQTYSSTDGEPCCTLRSSSPEEKAKERHKQQTGGPPPLHHLLGYASARDPTFVPGDEEDLYMYQSMDMSRSRRASDDVHDQGCGGTGRSSPAAAVGYTSPNHSEIEEEEEEPELGLPAGPRGRASVLESVRGDGEELSRGLEDMKLRSNRRRRSR